jgi:hypothetical protein
LQQRFRGGHESVFILSTGAVPAPDLTGKHRFYRCLSVVFAAGGDTGKLVDTYP